MAGFAEQMRAVIGCGAIDAEADGDAALGHLADGCDARSQAHVGAWAMRDAGAGAGEEVDAVVVELDAVRVPDVAADPAEFFGVFGGRAIKFLARVGDVVRVFGEVRVQRNAVGACECGRFAHEIPTDGKRRTRGDDDALHRVAGGVVVGLDEALGVAQDGGFVFDEAIGWEAAGATADAHAAPAGVETQADASGGFDGIVEAGAVGVEIKVIGRRGAAGENELGHRGEGGDADHLGREPGPDGVKGFEPAEEFHILRGGDSAGEALIHVVMRVDQAGEDDVSA